MTFLTTTIRRIGHLTTANTIISLPSAKRRRPSHPPQRASARPFLVADACALFGITIHRHFSRRHESGRAPVDIDFRRDAQAARELRARFLRRRHDFTSLAGSHITSAEYFHAAYRVYAAML